MPNPEVAVYDVVRRGDCLHKIAWRNQMALKTIMD